MIEKEQILEAFKFRHACKIFDESKKIAKFLIEQIAPTYFVIQRKDHAKLVEILEEEDYMPKPEIETFIPKSS